MQPLQPLQVRPAGCPGRARAEPGRADRAGRADPPLQGRGGGAHHGSLAHQLPRPGTRSCWSPGATSTRAGSTRASRRCPGGDAGGAAVPAHPSLLPWDGPDTWWRAGRRLRGVRPGRPGHVIPAQAPSLWRSPGPRRGAPETAGRPEAGGREWWCSRTTCCRTRPIRGSAQLMGCCSAPADAVLVHSPSWPSGSTGRRAEHVVVEPAAAPADRPRARRSPDQAPAASSPGPSAAGTAAGAGHRAGLQGRRPAAAGGGLRARGGGHRRRRAVGRGRRTGPRRGRRCPAGGAGATA